MIVYTAMATFIILKLVGIFVPLRLTDEELEVGDHAIHGNEVYPSDVPALGHPRGWGREAPLPWGRSRHAPGPARPPHGRAGTGRAGRGLVACAQVGAASRAVAKRRGSVRDATSLPAGQWQPRAGVIVSRARSPATRRRLLRPAPTDFAPHALRGRGASGARARSDTARPRRRSSYLCSGHVTSVTRAKAMPSGHTVVAGALRQHDRAVESRRRLNPELSACADCRGCSAPRRPGCERAASAQLQTLDVDLIAGRAAAAANPPNSWQGVDTPSRDMVAGMPSGSRLSTICR